MKADAPTLPAPGWYLDMPEETYHALPCCSASRLKTFEDCPARMRWEVANPKTTDAMIVGRALHCAVLEPERFGTAFAGIAQNTKAGKEAAAVFEAAGGTVISPAEFVMVKGMAQSIREHGHASEVMRHSTHRELTGIWKSEHGPLCKMRADLYSEQFGAILDVKTCQSVKRWEFEKTIADLRYYRQMAMYRAGAKALGLHISDLVIVAVEKTPPYYVGCFRITPEYLALGDVELRKLLEFWAECEESGSWPGYPEDFIDVDPPKWLVEKNFKDLRMDDGN